MTFSFQKTLQAAFWRWAAAGCEPWRSLLGRKDAPAFPAGSLLPSPQQEPLLCSCEGDAEPREVSLPLRNRCLVLGTATAP